MKPLIRILFTLITASVVTLASAQNGVKADSLRSVLASCESDTACLRLRLELCDYLLFADPSAAESYCQEALITSMEAKEAKSIGKALNYNGILATIQSRYMTAIERFQEALQHYEALGDLEGVSKLMNNIGVIYSSLENYDESIRYYKESLALNIEIEDHEGAVFNLYNIASDYMQLKEFTLSRAYADSLVRFQAVHGEYLKPYRIYGEWFLEQNELDSAEFFLMRSVDHMREMEEEHQLPGAFVSLAELHRKRGNFARASHFARRAEQFAEKNKSLEALVNVYDSQAKIYRDQGQFKPAFEALERYITKKDSLDEVNNFNLISELNTRFETERREKELAEKEALLVQREAAEKFQFRVFALITGFIVVVLALVSYSLIRKRRMNRILNQRNEEINSQRQKIISSINYAQKIQNAILLPEAHIQKFLPDSFIYFKPKDIVSGDFYWFAQIGEETYIATVDCTGHGVPGAFMSLIASSKLNKVVLELGLRDPGAILNKVHEEIMASLNQNDSLSENQDGMDMTLAIIGQKGDPIRFAGARNALLTVIDGEVLEHKVDYHSIGGTFFRDALANGAGFTTREIPYQSGALVILATDGYIDQFGGDDGKKMNKQRFREVLLELANRKDDDPKALLASQFEAWCGAHDQIDDVLIIGTRLV